MGVSIATVYNLISRMKSGTSLVHKNGAGRPGRLIPKVKKYVARTVNLNPSISIRNLTANCPVEVGRDTMNRCLRKLKYSKPYPTPVPLLSEKIDSIGSSGQRNTSMTNGIMLFSPMRPQFGCVEGVSGCGPKWAW